MPALPPTLSKILSGRMDEGEPTYRMSMLPFGTYADQNGRGEHLGLALPGMIHEPLSAVLRLAQNSRFSDGHLGIPNPQNSDNQHDVASLLETMFGGQATKGAGAVETAAVQHAWPELPNGLAFDTSRLDSNILGVRSGEREVGVAHYRPPDTASMTPAQISHLLVDPEFRRQGIANALQDAVEAHTNSHVTPDHVISADERARWLSRDPLAVQDYVPDGGQWWRQQPGVSAWMRPDTWNERFGDLTPSTMLDRSIKIENNPPGSYSKLKSQGLLSDNGLPSLPGAVVAGAEKTPGFDVWHGSPHDFDQFDMSKIGSGEGAQAYGHGLYFADSPGVADSYRGGNFLSHQSPVDQLVASFMSYGNGNIDDAIASAGRDITLDKSQPSGKPLTEAMDRLMAMKNGTASTKPGYLYQARINANPEDFLDYEKPLSQQTEAIRNALEPLRQNLLDDWGVTADDGAPNADFPGLKTLAAEYGPETTDALKAHGIPGIKYLDAGSRGAGDGSRNYVVFDHNLVDTLHKWRGDQQLYSDNGLPSLPGTVVASQDQDTQPPSSLSNLLRLLTQ